MTADGSSGFKAESGRYHLYVSLRLPLGPPDADLPQAQRPRRPHLGVGRQSADARERLDLRAEAPGVIPDPVNGARYLHEVYTAARPDYTGPGDGAGPVGQGNRHHRQQRVVRDHPDVRPRVRRRRRHRARLLPRPTLEDEIDAINAFVYDAVNNGVYKAGFATTQEAYEEAVSPLFAALDQLDARSRRAATWSATRSTEADWRLFTTLVRFDPVYVGHFKCNLRRIVDYPNLWGYTRELYQVPGVAETVHMDHIKSHYYRSHPTINPTGVVPAGPEIDFDAPHGREALGATPPADVTSAVIRL